MFSCLVMSMQSIYISVYRHVRSKIEDLLTHVRNMDELKVTECISYFNVTLRNNFGLRCYLLKYQTFYI